MYVQYKRERRKSERERERNHLCVNRFVRNARMIWLPDVISIIPNSTQLFEV
jgi:hypothetical protein